MILLLCGNLKREGLKERRGWISKITINNVNGTGYFVLPFLKSQVSETLAHFMLTALQTVCTSTSVGHDNDLTR